MRRFVFFLIVSALAIRYGVNYLTSEAFQKYGDKNKAAWTCDVSYYMAGLNGVMSNYKEAYDLYDRIAKRCPGKEVGISAQFSMAKTLEDMNRRADAYQAFKQFAEDHKDHPKAMVALRSAEILMSVR